MTDWELDTMCRQFEREDILAVVNPPVTVAICSE